MRYDLHTHSKYSRDGWMEPETLVKTAIKRGLAGIAVTDHNTIEGGFRAKEFETENFEVVVGSETSTDRGEVIGLFLSEEVVSRNFIEVIHEIQSQNGTVVLPHPFDELRGNGIAPTKEDVKLVDCIETFNSRCFRTRYNKMAAEYAGRYGLKSVGGSDAHFAHEVGGAGVITDDGLHDAFERGNFTVFGERSSIMNLGLTKVLKIWRKKGSGSY